MNLVHTEKSDFLRLKNDINKKMIMKSIHHCYGFCFHTTLILYYGQAVPRRVQITLVTSANISSRYSQPGNRFSRLPYLQSS